MDEVVLTRVCRMCLNTDVKMYDINGYKLHQIFNEVTGISMNRVITDKLPQKLCWECTQRLVSAHRARQKALRAHYLLLDVLNTNQFITMQHVKSINRCNYQLDSTLSTHFINSNDGNEMKMEVLDQEIENNNFDTRNDIVYASDDMKITSELSTPSIFFKSVEYDKMEAPSDVKPETDEIFFEVCDQQIEYDIFDTHNDVVCANDDRKNDIIDASLEIKPDITKIVIEESSIVNEDDGALFDGASSEVCKEKNNVKTNTDVQVKKSEKEVKQNVKVKMSVAEMRKKVTVKKSVQDTRKKVKIKKSVEEMKKKAKVKKSVEEMKKKVKVKKILGKVKTKVTVKTSEGEVEAAEKKKGGRKKQPIVEDLAKELVEKYRTSNVLRVHRRTDKLDVAQFTIKTLTYEGQIEEVNERRHSESYRNAPYQCHVCFKGFPEKLGYDVHAVWHTEESGAFECSICRNRFNTARNLHKHVASRHVEEYSCKRCPFVTRGRNAALQHQNWHGGAMHQCSYCPCKFDKRSTYLGHMRIKHAADFVCELCGFAFLNKRGLDVHKNKKHRVSVDAALLRGPYCEVCDVKFLSEDAHERHLKVSSKHSSKLDPIAMRNDSSKILKLNGPPGHAEAPWREPRESTEVIVCEQCGQHLNGLRRYAQHFRHAHPDKNRTQFCASYYDPVMCEHCGRICQNMTALDTHMWVHTAQKKYKCDHCDKSFTQKVNLAIHMQTHSGPRKTHECPVCGKHFTYRTNRSRHMLNHTGMRPFKCKMCDKTYTNSSELRTHVQHAHLKKPYPKRKRRVKKEM